jgi:hypothetical protein
MKFENDLNLFSDIISQKITKQLGNYLTNKSKRRLIIIKEIVYQDFLLLTHSML